MSLFFVLSPLKVGASQKSPAEIRSADQKVSQKVFPKGKREILSLLIKTKRAAKRQKAGKRPKNERITNGFAIASVVSGGLSILSLLSAVGILWLPLALAGIILGIIGLTQIDKYYDEFKGRKLAIVGIIISAASLLLPIFLVLLLLLIFL